MAGYAYELQRNKDGSLAAGNRPAGREGIVPTTALTIYDGDNNEIGHIIGMDESESRSAERIKHLNAFDAGETLEQVTRPADMTLNVRGFTIYKKPIPTLNGEDSILGRLAAGKSAARFFKSLEDQRIPFDIKAVDAYFDAEGNPVDIQGVIYRECVIVSSTKPRDINSAHSVETCSIQVGYAEPWNPTT